MYKTFLKGAEPVESHHVSVCQHEFHKLMERVKLTKVMRIVSAGR